MCEKDKKIYMIKGGGNDEKEQCKEDIRDLVQTILGNSVNLCTLIGSGASLPAI